MINEKLIAKIDFLIKEIEDDKIGWTTWAILAALATSFISLLNELKDFIGNYDVVLKFSVGIYLIYLLIRFTYRQRKKNEDSTKHTLIKSSTFFHSSYFISTTLEIIYSILIIILFGQIELNFFIKIAFIIFLFFRLVLCLFILSIEIINTPLVASNKKFNRNYQPKKIIGFIIYISVYLFYTLIPIIIFQPFLLDILNYINELKLAILFDASFVLLFYLSVTVSIFKSKPLECLKSIKFQYLNDEISEDEAEKFCLTIINGTFQKDYLSTYLQEFKFIIKQGNHILDRLEHYKLMIDDNNFLNFMDNIDDEKLAKFANIVTHNIEYLNSLLWRIVKLKFKLMFVFEIIKAQSANSKEIREIQEALDNDYNKLIERHDAFKKWCDVQKRILSK